MSLVVTLITKFLYFCLKQLGTNRCYRLFHELRIQDESFITSMLKNILIRELPIKILNHDFFEKYTYNDMQSRKVWPILVTNPNILESINAIPSETTPDERKYLFKFFSEMWDGQGNVLEIGPFLGGTTRAIGKGMIENPKLHTNSRLYTTDRFSMYYDKDRLKKLLHPLFSNGTINQSEFDLDKNPKTQFKDIFRKIHKKEDYYKLVEVMEEILPDLKEQLNYGDNS